METNSLRDFLVFNFVPLCFWGLSRFFLLGWRPNSLLSPILYFSSILLCF
ncbi:hypothetical protein Scep_004785 [Stephania cephalantha]|uniref:Uncharacterized protein n=1 Tax=Stephania cephalantha TaxID=152367 RepID=A0AAP0KT28_9MAGN